MFPIPRWPTIHGWADIAVASLLACGVGACAAPRVEIGLATPVPSTPTVVPTPSVALAGGLASPTPVGGTQASALGVLPADLPSSFPLPPQYQVVASSSDGTTINVVLSVPDANATYALYRTTLPANGWQVQEVGSVQTAGAAIGALMFSNADFTGQLVFGPSLGILVNGSNGVALTLHRKAVH